jgi:hypothetical protein
MGSAFQENKGPKKDEGPLINKLREHAERVVGEQVAQDLRTLAAKKEAYLLAHQNVVKLVHIGGCPRAYSALCPKGWTESSVTTAFGHLKLYLVNAALVVRQPRDVHIYSIGTDLHTAGGYAVVMRLALYGFTAITGP